MNYKFAHRNPINFVDFYKVGHINQYPKGTSQVWSNWTPRNSRVPGTAKIVNFGLTYFIKAYLDEQFSTYFFGRPIWEVLNEYRDIIKATLGVQEPRTDHIEALHRLGYLPLKIYALPEGAMVPLNVPTFIITNTRPEFFWLPNYLETMLSNCLWKTSTSATTARRYREVCLKHARRSGETDFGFIDWQCHDFSYRGMSGTEDAKLSGMGHLLYFSGTDTVPAILAAHAYYNAPLSCGGSVPATEHSVMCAGEEDGEFETFKRLLTEVYPSGIVSVVSDTWDLWRVLTDYIPRLKDTILAREGKLVIRPDSGDPIEILCGSGSSNSAYPSSRGTVRLLAEALGTTPQNSGLPLINKAGAIYGDSITVARADEILQRTVDELKLSPYNVVFGVGSFTYQMVTRDTYGWAMKATAVRRDGKIVPIFKKPVTDDGGKFSHKGLLAAYVCTDAELNLTYMLRQGVTEEQLENCAYRKVYENGDLLHAPDFATIRQLARMGL